MALDKVTYAAAKKYVDKSIAGGGISAGKNCTIDNISPITGGNRVTFKWTLDDGTVQTQTMDVMNGDKGDTGLGIKAVSINTQNHLIITFDDDTTYDAGELPGGSGEVISVNGKKGVVTLDANDVGALPDNTELFSGDYNDLDNLPDLTNFITNTVDNLVNYYKKTETYTKAEVDGIVEAIKNSRFEVVFTLPTTDIKTNVIYLVPKPTTKTQNVKDEYINLDGTSAGWEKIGDTEIDLSGYVTTTALNTALADYTTTTDLTTLLAGKVDKVTGKGLSTNDYTNTDKELVDSIPNLAPISLLKDTVGWTGKNLLKNTAKSGSNQGITYTVNSDKSITINGTNTDSAQHSVTVGVVTLDAGAYKVNGLKNNGGYTSFWINLYNLTDGSNIVDVKNANEDVTFTLSAPKQVRVHVYWAGNATVSNITIYPMLRKANITDPTYEPYHESVEAMYEEEIHGINLLKYNAEIVPGYTKTSYGITCVVNDDYSVTANGTRETGSGGGGLGISTTYEYPPGDYIVSGCPKGGSISTYMLYIGDSSWTLLAADTGSGAHIHLSTKQIVKFEVHITSGTTVNNLVFKPMLRKANIEDSTYRPCNSQAIQNQLNDKGVLGAKNLLLNTSSSGTYNGITFTKNSDGSVTVNGTATGLTWRSIGSLKLPVGKYILNGCPSGGDTGPATYCIALWNTDGGTAGSIINVRDAGEGVIVDITQELTYLVSVGIANGYTVNNLTFKPMLRLASDPDDTYVPYAMTNRELTEDRYYHAGDTVNVSLMNFSALITNSSKEIRFTIPLMKDLSKIAGITFKNTTTVGIRKPEGGYIIDGVISSGYTITILAKVGNLLSLKLTKTDDSAFDATNNMPLDVAFTGGSNDSVITFS